MRICSFCGGDLDSTAGCRCPRPFLTTTSPPLPICVPPAYPPPSEVSVPTAQTEIDWRARALTAEAKYAEAVEACKKQHDEIIDLRQRVWDLQEREAEVARLRPVVEAARRLTAALRTFDELEEAHDANESQEMQARFRAANNEIIDAQYAVAAAIAMCKEV